MKVGLLLEGYPFFVCDCEGHLSIDSKEYEKIRRNKKMSCSPVIDR
ncbi:hypothetical protein BRIN106911_23170 [Brevibacillus invocatus]